MEKLTAEMGNSSSAWHLISIDGLVIGEVIARSPAVIAALSILIGFPVFQREVFSWFLMPGIISIVLMFISFLLASITIVQERSKKTLIRTLLTPLSLGMFLFEKTAALIIIAFIQGIIMLIVAFVFYGIWSTWSTGAAFPYYPCICSGIYRHRNGTCYTCWIRNTAMLLTLVLSIPHALPFRGFLPVWDQPDLMICLGTPFLSQWAQQAFESVLIYQKDLRLFQCTWPLLFMGCRTWLPYILLRKEIMDWGPVQKHYHPAHLWNPMSSYPVVCLDHISFIRDDRTIPPWYITSHRKGQHWAIIGPEWLGKTSLVSIINGYHFPRRKSAGPWKEFAKQISGNSACIARSKSEIK